jgi:hypothetical protein
VTFAAGSGSSSTIISLNNGTHHVFTLPSLLLATCAVCRCRAGRFVHRG